MTTFLGIDPGKSGGVALLWVHGNGEAEPQLWKMPPTVPESLELICDLGHEHPVLAVLEDVASSPQMGVKSAFSFGYAFGSIKTAIVAAGIPLELVKPQRWQRALGCLSGGDKNVTKARAQMLFPGVKITHATADALLLAEYGRRLYRRVLAK